MGVIRTKTFGCFYNQDYDFLIGEGSIRSLIFSNNWNNKLGNKAFTSIRLHNDLRYVVGDIYEVVLKGEPQGLVRLISKRFLLIDEIDDFVSYIDTGYNAQETIRLLKTMYKNKDIDWDTQFLDVCLFR